MLAQSGAETLPARRLIAVIGFYTLALSNAYRSHDAPSFENE